MYPQNPPTPEPQHQAEKEAKKNLRPQDMFLVETDKYSAFDEDGALCGWLMDGNVHVHSWIGRLEWTIAR